MRIKQPWIVFCACAAIALAFAQPGWAQGAYPNKSIKFIAPYPPGGTTDVLARLLAVKLGDSLGQTLVVDNRPGATGNIGQEIAAKAAPDGYTLVLTASTALNTNIHLYKHLPFDPFNDYAPISMVASAGSVLVVHPSVPAKSVAELIALAKSQPGKLNYGSGGLGTPAHIVGALFAQITGINIVHVPYKGTIQSVTDLVAGQLDMVFSDMVPAIPQIKGGTLRALAVTSPQRSPILPDVPTLAELGFTKPMPQNWWCVLAPKGTPVAIVNRLNGDLGKILKDKDVVDRYNSLGIVSISSTPAAVMERAKTESVEIGKLLKDAGVQPE